VSAVDFRAADFLAALQALLPQGAAWPRDPDAVLTQTLDAMADRLAAVQARIVTVLEAESFPPATAELLADWERAFGLPDICAAPEDGTSARRAALVARIIEQGGQSRAYFIAYAAALGFAVTITEFTPARIGEAAIGTPIYDDRWAHAWRVNAPATTVIESRIGLSSIGDPLREWGNDRLECALGHVKPAHTHLLFGYS
jgi:uncharacterized protein YmfQ (DUF2313 family)